MQDGLVEVVPLPEVVADDPLVQADAALEEPRELLGLHRVAEETHRLQVQHPFLHVAVEVVRRSLRGKRGGFRVIECFSGVVLSSNAARIDNAAPHDIILFTHPNLIRLNVLADTPAYQRTVERIIPITTHNVTTHK